MRTLIIILFILLAGFGFFRMRFGVSVLPKDLARQMGTAPPEIVVQTDFNDGPMEWSEEEISYLKSHGLYNHAITLTKAQGGMLREIIHVEINNQIINKAILDSLKQYYPDLDFDYLQQPITH